MANAVTALMSEAGAVTAAVPKVGWIVPTAMSAVQLWKKVRLANVTTALQSWKSALIAALLLKPCAIACRPTSANAQLKQLTAKQLEETDMGYGPISPSGKVLPVTLWKDSWAAREEERRKAVKTDKRWPIAAPLKKAI